MVLALLGCEVCPSPEVTETTISSGPIDFDRTVLQANICGPAIVDAADLDGDGADEVVVSTFGRARGMSVPNGTLSIYDAEGFREAVITEDDEYKWPNGSTPLDVDGDGDLDLVVGLGFLTCQIDPFTSDCGGLLWFENPEWTVHELVAPGAEGFFHHAALADIDGDGFDDIVSANESQATPLGTEAGSEVLLFRGPDYVDVTSLGEGMGFYIHADDVDADGDLDLVGSNYWGVEDVGYSWMENADGWPTHAIDDASGPAIHIAPMADGRWIGSNHVGAGDPYGPTVSLYTPGDDVRALWTREDLATDFFAPEGAGSAAPGVISIGDIDGDGDEDVLVSGDGDRDIHWIEQDGDTWHHHVLDVELPQAGVALTDMDGDGRVELLVSSWETNLLLRYVPQ